MRLLNSMLEQDPRNEDGTARSQRDEFILDSYRAGAPVADLAREAGVCLKTVRNVARSEFRSRVSPVKRGR